MSNQLLALGILCLVIQQLISLGNQAAQWATLNADDKRSLILKLIAVILGVLGAELLMLNIVPDGVFDTTVSIYVLRGLTGILAGFGYDIAVGAINLGKSGAQFVQAKTQAAKAQAAPSPTLTTAH